MKKAWFSIYSVIQIPLLLMFALSGLHAQPINVNSEVDSSSIIVGSPFQYHVTVQHGENIKVQWPAFLDTLGAFEILESSDIDTSKNEQGIIQKQTLKLTSFEPGMQTLPSQPFAYHKAGNTSIQRISTDTIRVNVQTMAVDTSKAIKPVKGIYDIPLTFAEIWPYLAAGVGLILLIILSVWLYKRWKQKPESVEAAKPTKAPHEIAIEKLEALKNQQLWQQAYVKEYHDQLTDIIREYLEGVYKIYALELTTGEIMDQLRDKPISQYQKDQLRKIFETADLAKFAKANPSPEANQEAMDIAFAFIRESKGPEVTTDSPSKHNT